MSRARARDARDVGGYFAIIELNSLPTMKMFTTLKAGAAGARSTGAASASGARAGARTYTGARTATGARASAAGTGARTLFTKTTTIPRAATVIGTAGRTSGTNFSITFGGTFGVRTYAQDRLGEKIDTKIDTLSDSQYNQISNMYLEDLGDELELISEDYPEIDFELSQGVLTLNTSKGTYVINRQPPNKQMWLSSPLTGPNRYDLIGGEWVSLRDHGKLTELLSHELGNILGTSVGLQLPN